MKYPYTAWIQSDDNKTWIFHLTIKNNIYR